MPAAAVRPLRPVAVLLVLLLVRPGVAGAALDCPPLPDATRFDASGIRHPHGLLWSVTAPGGARSMLLGTMHVSDPRVTAVSEAVAGDLEAADIFVMEVVLDVDALAELQRAMFYGGGRSLRDVAGPELFERAASAMRGYGIPAEVVARMKPWAVLTTLSLPAGPPGVALDLELMLDARAAGKAVAGLESAAEQVDVFESLSEADQIAALRQVACHHEVLQADVERMVQRYAARDLAGLARIALEHAGVHGTALLEALLFERNERMLERLAPLLDEGAAFVAVGALHLPGARGLLQGLERRGYTVEAIY